jgi:hypothetical protein
MNPESRSEDHKDGWKRPRACPPPCDPGGAMLAPCGSPPGQRHGRWGYLLRVTGQVHYAQDKKAATSWGTA